MTGRLCPISIYRSPVTLLKLQMAPRLILLLMSSGSKKEPRYACLSEAKTSHSQRMWAEVSFVAPHLLRSGLSDSPSRWRCLLRVLCPVRRPVTALDCVLLKDKNLALAPRQGPKIAEPSLVNSSAISLPRTPVCPGTQYSPTAWRAEISFNAFWHCWTNGDVQRTGHKRSFTNLKTVAKDYIMYICTQLPV
jgi:hypothetical protein